MRKFDLEQKELDQKIEDETNDITLSGRNQNYGGYHPITLTKELIGKCFTTIGYKVVEDPKLKMIIII